MCKICLLDNKLKLQIYNRNMYSDQSNTKHNDINVYNNRVIIHLYILLQ